MENHATTIQTAKMSPKLGFEGVYHDVFDKQFDYLEKKKTEKVMSSLLRAFLKNTHRTCSFYRKLIDAEGIKIDEISSYRDFSRVPLLTPSVLKTVSPEELLPDQYGLAIKNGSSLAFLPPEERFAHKFSTSGSTGHPKVVYYTNTDWTNAKMAILRALAHLPFSDYCRTFNCFNPGHVAAPVFRDALHSAGAIVVNKHFTHLDEKAILKQMTDEYSHVGGFTCLAIPPCTPPNTTKKGGTLRALLDNDAENIIGKSIRLIITTGAPREHKDYGFKLIEEVHELNELAGAKFRTKFVDFAGCAEVLPTCAECQVYGNGLHLLPGVTFTEVIDAQTGEHVQDGETGLLAYTGLKNGSRYVRYIVGDEAKYIEERCSCGRTTPRITNISRVIDKERLEMGCASGF